MKKWKNIAEENDVFQSVVLPVFSLGDYYLGSYGSNKKYVLSSKVCVSPWFNEALNSPQTQWKLEKYTLFMKEIVEQQLFDMYPYWRRHFYGFSTINLNHKWLETKAKATTVKTQFFWNLSCCKVIKRSDQYILQ